MKIAAHLRRVRQPLMLAHDAVVLVAAYLVFTTIRYGAGTTAQVWADVAVVATVALVLHLALGVLTQVYRQRYLVASLEEMVALGAAALTAGGMTGLFNLALTNSISRAVPLAATCAALFVMFFTRVLWRHHWDRHEVRAAGPTHQAQRALVYGAGYGGRQLIRSMRTTAESAYHPVGLLDDDHQKRNLSLHGVRVLGGLADLPRAVERTGATVLVVAIPSADSGLIRTVSDLAGDLGLAVKVLPGVSELFARPITIRDVRDIDVADLLGRTRVETDISAIAGYLTGKRVLVTGAGGSIGSELARQIHKWGPAELMMLDRDESALHSVQLSIHGRALLDSDDVVLADIRDAEALDAIFVERRPEVVFHAAALKHLPMLEQYPSEALKTNVLGTINVLRAATAVGVERFVNISTDKAADPSSVLGLSKRVAERVTADVAAATHGVFLSVRFGNVLGSRGSVLTSFAAQIARGGPVTVTHPEVTRFFMTVEEAVELVIQAAAIGSDGEALILDMGDPVKIEDVARQLIAQSGKNIEIVYTGLREGEKLHEQLLGLEESDTHRSHPLVSHVPVQPLDVEEVGRVATSARPARAVLEDMCGRLPAQRRSTPAGTVIQPRTEAVPLTSREWSLSEK